MCESNTCVCECSSHVCVCVGVSVCMGLLGDQVAVLASLCDRINCLLLQGACAQIYPEEKGTVLRY